MVIRILQAKVIDDDLETTDDETDYGSVLNVTDQDSEHETDGEDGNNATIVESPSTEPPQGTSKQGEKITKPSKKITTPKKNHSETETEEKF